MERVAQSNGDQLERVGQSDRNFLTSLNCWMPPWTTSNFTVARNEQKIVVKVSMNGDKKARKAMQIAVGISGVESVYFVGSDKDRIAVTGEGIDTVKLVSLLRKEVGYTELVSIGPVGESKMANANITSFSLHDFAHLHIPLEDISTATSKFADSNIIGLGVAGKLYKGQLKWYGRLIDIVARRIEDLNWLGEYELWAEMWMLSRHKHENLVSIFGYCIENDEKIIIYEHAGHGCLDQRLSDPDLTCSKMLQICLGAARALKKIHYDFIQCGVSSSKILIDKDWKAKVFGFGMATRYPGNWGHRLLLSHYKDMSANKDPVRVTPKYDVYTFGLLLYDVLCRGKPMIKDCVKGKLDEMINPDLRQQMGSQSFTIMSKLVDNCLNQESVQRPSMNQIVTELENILELQTKPKDLEHSTLADEDASSNILTDEKVLRLKIPLSDITLATDNFSETYFIGSGGYGKVYKAELDHLDIQSDWKNKNEARKKRSTVAIKRITNVTGEEGFLAEIKMLTCCSHPNIISLLGFSNEATVMILVFEFALKGSLDDLLKSKIADITWAQRIQICLDVARGLEYLHTNMVGKRAILHRDVKSANILLDGNLNAKVADFGLSKIYPEGKTLMSALKTMRIAGTEVYLDPEYSSTGNYAKASDIYSLGVVLFEILSGRLAYDQIYNMGNDKGLAMVARRHFNNGTIKELIDPNMMEESDDDIFTVNKEPTEQSLDAFTKIAYQCLSETQKERPKMEDIIKELEDALKFQGKSLVLTKFRLSDIVSMTQNFSAKYYIGVGAYGTMYNAKLHYDRKKLSKIEGKDGGEQPKRGNINVALKHIFNREDTQAKHGFFAEIGMLAAFKHANIVSLHGVSCEDHEMVLIYEDDFRQSLHDYLRNTNKLSNLNWAQRIQISLDIACGLKYLQTSAQDREMRMQFDMNSANILLDGKCRAKIACFWLSDFVSADKVANILNINRRNKEANILDINNIVAREVQSYPEYIKIEMLKKESSIYSFGVILFEILCGKVQYDESYYAKREKGLPFIARRCFEERKILTEMIDPNLKEETDEKAFRLSEEVNQDSFDALLEIAYKWASINGRHHKQTYEGIKTSGGTLEDWSHGKGGTLEDST